MWVHFSIHFNILSVLFFFLFFSFYYFYYYYFIIFLFYFFFYYFLFLFIFIFLFFFSKFLIFHETGEIVNDKQTTPKNQYLYLKPFDKTNKNNRRRKRKRNLHATHFLFIQSRHSDHHLSTASFSENKRCISSTTKSLFNNTATRKGVKEKRIDHFADY